jgi:hypothetical protein
VPPPRPVQQEPSLPSQAVPTPTTAPPQSTGPTFLSLLFRHLRSDPQARICRCSGILVFTFDVPSGLGMFFFLTFIVRVIVTPSLALVFVASMYSLFWLPQIVRSVKKGRSSALTPEYLIGTSLCRLFHALCEYRWICRLFMSNTSIFSDFLTCPKNVLDVEPRRRYRVVDQPDLTYTLLGWMWYLAIFIFLQVAMILLQQRFGPAFFLPKRVGCVFQSYICFLLSIAVCSCASTRLSSSITAFCC